MAKHELSLEPVYMTVPGDFGPVTLLRGHRGVCSCGAKSAVYGVAEIPRQWHDWHTKPLASGAVRSRYGRPPGA